MTAGAVAVLVGATAGCAGASVARPAPGAPVVVTGVWALGQIAASVGGGALRVVDVVPAGTDPMAPLTAAEAAQVASADVVIEVGGGYQPSFERAATGARHVVEMASNRQAADAGPWLDPKRLDATANALAAVLTAIDPKLAQTFANGARDVVAQDSSLSADLHVTLSDCPRSTIVTPDGTFADFAAANGITDRPIGTTPSPTPGQVDAAATEIRSTRATTAFTEPWTNDALITAATRQAGVKAAHLDTLVGAPAAGYPKGATYTCELEEDLGAMTVALSCPQMGQS